MTAEILTKSSSLTPATPMSSLPPVPSYTVLQQVPAMPRVHPTPMLKTMTPTVHPTPMLKTQSPPQRIAETSIVMIPNTETPSGLFCNSMTHTKHYLLTDR